MSENALKAMRTERDIWKERAQHFEQEARRWQGLAETAEDIKPSPPIGPFYDHQHNEYLLTGEYRSPTHYEYWLVSNPAEWWVTGGYALAHSGTGERRWIVRPVNTCTCRPEREVKAATLSEAASELKQWASELEAGHA